jgi:hypothetical protein
MNVLKRLAVPVVAVAVFGLVAGCSQAPNGEGGGGGIFSRLSPADREHTRKLEEANDKLENGMLQANLALTMAQGALQLKLQDNLSVEDGAAPAAPAATPAEAEHAEAAPAEAESAATAAEGAMTATEGAATATEGVSAEAEGAAAVPAAPVAPTLIERAIYANQQLDQAYAMLQQVEQDTKVLFEGEYAEQAKVKSLRQLLDVASDFVKVVAGLSPVNQNLLDLYAQAEQAALGAEGAATATDGAATGTDAAATAVEGEDAVADEGAILEEEAPAEAGAAGESLSGEAAPAAPAEPAAPADHAAEPAAPAAPASH